MVLMIVGLVLFLGAHSLPMAPRLHDSLRDRVGATGYRIAFSIVSFVGIVATVRGYVLWKFVEGAPTLSVPPASLRHLALLLMLIAFILLFAWMNKR